MATHGEQIATLLVDRGIAVAFAIPAFETAEICRGVSAARLRLIIAPGGAEAGFMADGYARLTRQPAACIVPPGPALLALAPALAQARSDAVPMLVIVPSDPADGDGPSAGRGSIAGASAALMATLCRFTAVVEDGETLPSVLDDALAALSATRPGPVLVMITPQALAAAARGAPAAPRAPAASPPADPAVLATAVMRIAASPRPVLVFGEAASGVPRDDAVALAERIGAPVILTNGARGLLPAGHPLLVPVAVSDVGARAILASAEVVIAIGCGFGPAEWGLEPGAPLPIAPEALVCIDADGAILSRLAAPGIAVAADPAAAIADMLASLPEKPGAEPVPGDLRSQALLATPYTLMRHEALLASLWAHMPGAVVFADPCEPAHAGLLLAQPPGPNQWHAASAGFGVAGHAVWAALGARIGDGERPVIALIGDAQAPRQLALLPTAVAARAPVIILVWNNCGAGELRAHFEARRIEGIALDVPAFDMHHVVQALGGAHSRVLHPEHLRESLMLARERRKPTVIELREDYWFG